MVMRSGIAGTRCPRPDFVRIHPIARFGSSEVRAPEILLRTNPEVGRLAPAAVLYLSCREAATVARPDLGSLCVDRLCVGMEQQPDFSVPIDERHFEDYVPGFEQVYGTVSVTEADILEFARRWDPQDMHIDPEKAARGPFKGLIASGWHTAGMLMRLYAENYLSKCASLASPGLDELRWHKPVRPGDELRIRVRVLAAERSRSKPDRGMVRTGIEVLNQHGEVVMSLRAMNFLACRSPA